MNFKYEIRKAKHELNLTKRLMEDNKRKGTELDEERNSYLNLWEQTDKKLRKEYLAQIEMYLFRVFKHI